MTPRAVWFFRFWACSLQKIIFLQQSLYILYNIIFVFLFAISKIELASTNFQTHNIVYYLFFVHKPKTNFPSPRSPTPPLPIHTNTTGVPICTRVLPKQNRKNRIIVPTAAAEVRHYILYYIFFAQNKMRRVLWTIFRLPLPVVYNDIKFHMPLMRK